MQFKTWLEMQIQTQDHRTIMDRIEKLLNDIESAGYDVDDVGLEIPLIRDVINRLERGWHYQSYRQLRAYVYRLRSVRNKKLSDEAAEIFHQLRNREDMTQKDTFKLRAGDGSIDIFPSNPTSSFLKHDPEHSKDAMNKVKLMKMFNWARNVLLKYNDAKNIIESLEKDIFDKISWFALLDFAEEKGYSVMKLREFIEEIFEAEPQEYEQPGGRIKGWR